MNTISRVTIFGFVFFIAAAIGLAAFWVRSPYATEQGVVRVQPVPFSHQHHVGDVGIDCRYCHRTVDRGAFAGLPSTEICMDCHSQLWADSPMLAPVRDSYQNNEPLRWSRVHDLPDFAYFHHGIHVQKGIACEVCHGRVGEMPLMYRQETLHMEWCLSCHRHPTEHQVAPETLFERETSVLSELERATEEAASRSEESPKIPEAKSLTNCSICHR